MEPFVIQTHRLTKQYGGQAGVFDLDLHVRRGTIYGLLGRNGAGKSTTMKLLLGLIRPTAGEVSLWDTPLAGHERELLPRIGSMIEAPGFYPNLTGTENLRLFAALRGIPRRSAVQDALELVGLPYRDRKRFAQYSMGMKQRLAIALAVLHDPELLILDEPVNGLDPIGIAEMRDFIRRLCREQGKTILLSSHILSEVALLADDVGIIDHGRLLEEESMAVLEKKNRQYIRLGVSDAAQAAHLLENTLGIRDFTAENDHTLCVYDLQFDPTRLAQALQEQGIALSELHRCQDTLEDYFKRVTGGEGLG